MGPAALRRPPVGDDATTAEEPAKAPAKVRIIPYTGSVITKAHPRARGLSLLFLTYY